jgi:hypothetical protein
MELTHLDLDGLVWIGSGAVPSGLLDQLPTMCHD